GVDRKKTKRVDASLGVECDVELALDLRVAGGGGVGSPGKDVELDGRVTPAPGVAASPGIENETGEAEAFECSADAALELQRVERAVNPDYMHGAVRIELAPAQHGRLEQVEPSHSPLLFATLASRRARMSFCASNAQCFLTLYQMSAAWTMLDVSMP